MIEDLRLNYMAMPAEKRRKVITYTVIGVIVFSLLIVGPILRQSDRQDQAKIKSISSLNGSKKEEGGLNLGDTPNNDWLDRAMRSSAASHRNKLKQDIELLTIKLENYQSGTSEDLDEIQSTLNTLETLSKSLALDIAKERALRKTSDKFIIEKLGDTSGEGMMVGVEGSSEFNVTEFNSLSQTSAGISPQVKKLNPFDMMAVAQHHGMSINMLARSSKATNNVNSNIQNPQVIENKIDRKGNAIPTKSGADKKTPVSDSIDSPKINKKEKKVLAKISTGSLIRARLVNGLNAVVANTADSDKLIVLAKLTDPILMPNGRKVSLRGCTIMGGGKGDLSTERVYINTTIISCISDDDVLYEATVKSNAIGEDGVLGLRGRPVTKDGALLLQSTGTGLIQGFAQAFSNSSQQPQIVTSSNGSYSLPPMDYVANSSLASGIDSGLEQMVKRANGILDQIFPVLEIDAARSIEFVVQESFELKEI